VAAKKSAVFRLANTRHRENLKEIMKMALFTVLEEGRINLASKLRPRRQRVWNCGVEFKSPFIRMKSLQQSFSVARRSVLERVRHLVRAYCAGELQKAGSSLGSPVLGGRPVAPTPHPEFWRIPAA